MFGHQDSNNHDAAQQAAPSTDGILSHPVAPASFAPTASTPLPAGDDPDNYIMTDLTATQPAQTQNPAGSVPPTIPAFAAGPADDAATSATPPAADATSAPAVDSGLLEIKQSALQELTPLIDHLEQTAEEKFRTMMMMIQASDDQSLLADAYHAAQAIEDKKARAQALLDVVNEINYFTQQHPDSGTPQ